MGFALVTAVGWGLNWPVPKYLLTELPLLSTLKQGTNFAAVHESAFGTKRTSKRRPAMSAFGGIADIAQGSRNVRF